MTTAAPSLDTGARDNSHLTPEHARRALADPLAALEQRIGSRIQLAPLGKLKPVADATTKLLLTNERNKPVGVLICSRPAAPEMVERGTALAEQIGNLLGDPLRGAIIQPIERGRIDGRSYVIHPCYHEFARSRPLRVCQRHRLTRPLLTWLRRATARAAHAHQPHESAPADFHAMLEHLARQPFLDQISPDLPDAVRQSIARIESGLWQPRHTFDHNDFWLGNVMLTHRTGILAARGQYPFMLIDWPGANPRGYGIYDLIRLARGLKLSPRALRRELTAHAAALNCDLTDTRGHLLAALGRLHRHIEQFPTQQYLHICRTSLTWYQAAESQGN